MRTLLAFITVWVATIPLATIAVIGRLLGRHEGEHGVAQWCMRTWARSLCAAAGARVVVHDPERILHPLRRKGPRGGGREHLSE